MIPTLLLAAGRSTRMGGVDKLLQEIAGEPLLTRMANRALALGPVLVTLPSLSHTRYAAVPKAAQVVVVEGTMSDSLKAGIAALPDSATGVLILPADMPDIITDDLLAVRDAALDSGAPIVRATTQAGAPGHPIYFAADQFARFATLDGDRGAMRLTMDMEDRTVNVPLPGNRARLDLDTPDDWAAYRAR